MHKEKYECVSAESEHQGAKTGALYIKVSGYICATIKKGRLCTRERVFCRKLWLLQMQRVQSALMSCSLIELTTFFLFFYKNKKFENENVICMSPSALSPLSQCMRPLAHTYIRTMRMLVTLEDRSCSPHQDTNKQQQQKTQS